MSRTLDFVKYKSQNSVKRNVGAQKSHLLSWLKWKKSFGQVKRTIMDDQYVCKVNHAKNSARLYSLYVISAIYFISIFFIFFFTLTESLSTVRLQYLSTCAIYWWSSIRIRSFRRIYRYLFHSIPFLSCSHQHSFNVNLLNSGRVVSLVIVYVCFFFHSRSTNNNNNKW